MQSILLSTKRSHRIIVVLVAAVAVLLSTSFAPNAHAAPNLPIVTARAAGSVPALTIYQHANYGGLASTLYRPGQGDCDGFGYDLKFDYWQQVNGSSLRKVAGRCNYVILRTIPPFRFSEKACGSGRLDMAWVGDACNDRITSINLSYRP